MTKGVFISIEGSDGSGKSTQIELLKEYLGSRDIQATFLREPGGTAISEKIRDVILDIENSKMCDMTEMLLYAAARAQLVYEVIIPQVEAGRIVICDRFVDSSYAYQSFARGLRLEDVRSVNYMAIKGFMPDLTLFFDISPQDALDRRLKATAADRLEKEPQRFHQDVYEGYQFLAAQAPGRIKVIDATKGIDQVADEVRKLINGILNIQD